MLKTKRHAIAVASGAVVNAYEMAGDGDAE
jgi:hypothetical protein